MRLSEERIEVIADAIVDRLAEEELVDLTLDEERLAGSIARLIAADLAKEEAIQRDAVAWLERHRPHLEPGTSAWSIELERKREEIAVTRGYVLP
jgi:hypothetical protein